ncbi:MAG TPA: DsbA family oxidoreductase [Rhodospirillales bacterium]|nr:DsbA family oxidoreductase [Rhodospirillales bacterium]
MDKALPLVKKPLRVDFIFDPGCPWCFIGKRRLEAALALRPNLAVERHWWPFLLNPDIPATGIERTAYLLGKFGNESRVREIFRAIEHAGLSAGIAFEFDRIEKMPNMIDAHRLIRYAGLEGKAEETLDRLYESYFILGLDIGETGVLMEIGEGLGLEILGLRAYLRSDEDRKLIYEESARAHRLGVGGVPTFIFNDDFIISGAQEAQTLARVMDGAAAFQALSRSDFG